MKNLILLMLCVLCSVINQVSAQNQNLSKKQFEKSLTKIQKCSGLDEGSGHIQTDLGQASIFWRDDMIKVVWKESIGDTTYVSHNRVLYRYHYEALEIKEYYYANGISAGDIFEPRTKLSSTDEYDQGFVDLLKEKKCMEDLRMFLPYNNSPAEKFSVTLARVVNCFDKKSGTKTIENYGGEGNKVTIEWKNDLIKLTYFVKGENLGTTIETIVYPEGGFNAKYGYSPMGDGLYMEYDIYDTIEVDVTDYTKAWEKEVYEAHNFLSMFLDEQCEVKK